MTSKKGQTIEKGNKKPGKVQKSSKDLPTPNYQPPTPPKPQTGKK